MLFSGGVGGGGEGCFGSKGDGGGGEGEKEEEVNVDTRFGGYYLSPDLRTTGLGREETRPFFDVPRDL